jgi:hypothetical protein
LYNLLNLANQTKLFELPKSPKSPKSLNIFTLAIPLNVREVEVLYNRIIQSKSSIESSALDQLKKLQKGIYKALATAETNRITNNWLLEVAREEKRNGKRKKGKGCGFGRVMGIEVLEQRNKEAIDRAISKVWTTEYTKINPSIFSMPIVAKKASSPTKKRALEVVEQSLEKRLRLEYIREEEEVRIEAPETRTRSGRTVKRTSKARN